jgi:type IV pilus assembly protein PilX
MKNKNNNLLGYYKVSQQQGSSLMVALVMLLVITLMAISSVKEATLETRIAGNMIEQQRLTNYAEAALREGQSIMHSATKPREHNSGSCKGASYCFDKKEILCTEAVDYFDDDQKYTEYPLNGNDNHKYKVIWYATTVPSRTIEYGNAMLGRDTFRYEISAEATNTDSKQKIRLCSTTSKVFNY